jgi:hypothetical protein
LLANEAPLASKADLAHLTAMDGGNAKGLQEQSLPRASQHLHIHVQARSYSKPRLVFALDSVHVRLSDGE